MDLLKISFFAIILFAFASCKAKKETVKTEYITVVDSTAILQKDSLITKLQGEYNREREYTTHLQTVLASTISGTAGEKKNKVINKEPKRLALKSGLDSIVIVGVWEYFDYKWFKAPTRNLYQKRTDSITEVVKSYEGRYSKAQNEINKLRSKIKNSSTEKTNFKIDWRFIIIAYLLGVLTLYLIQIKIK